MGPLSIKAQVQADAGAAKNQMLVIKTLADEARKKKQAEADAVRKQELHQIKVAKEIAKAKAEGIPIDQSKIGASDGVPDIPKPNNPEAGPSDTIPAMLTPGEAVIPASVAQDPQHKPIIEALVNEGRTRNRMDGGVKEGVPKPKGFADGTTATDEEFERLLAVQRQIESGGRHITNGALTTSPKGAFGVAQIMPATSKDPGYGIAPLKDNSEEESKRFQRDYMTAMLGKFKDRDLALAAYNYGPGNVEKLVKTRGDKWREHLPEETAGYLKKINSGMIPTGAETKQAVDAVPRPHRRGGTSGMMRDLSQGQLNPVYDAELKAMEASGNPEDQSIARAEMARLQRTRSIPVMQTPDGVPVEVPAPAPKAPDGFAVPKPVIGVAGAVDDDNQVLPTTVAAKQQALEGMLEDPTIKAELDAAQKVVPPANLKTPEEQKGWLAKQLEKIFGKTGMFKDEDLIRFSLLAAGGMLTGGSVGGSLRFAGLDTLRYSDKRKSEEEMAARQHASQVAITERQAAAQKAADIRMMHKDGIDYNQTLTGTYNSKLDKASPEAKVLADKIFQESRAPGLSLAQREARLQQAVSILASNQVDTTGKHKDPVTGVDSVTGRPIEYRWDGDTQLVRPAGSNATWTPAHVAKVKPVLASEYRASETAAVEKMSVPIADRLMATNRKDKSGKLYDEKYTDTYAKSHAKAIATELLEMKQYFGENFNDRAMGKVSSHVINAIQEEYRGRSLSQLSPEALQKLVYGHAIVALRQTNEHLYVRDTPDGKKPAGVEAVLQYGNVIKDLVDTQNKSQDGAIKELEEEWSKLDPKVQQQFTQAASVARGGYSPYLLWVAKKGKLN
jgi:hypothetical protein